MSIKQVSTLLIAALAIGQVPVAGTQERWDAEQQAVVDAVEGYLNAWNDADAVRLASYCQEDYDRIDARGNIYRGKETIREHYTEVFARPRPAGPGQSLSYDIFSVRLVTPDVAVVDAYYTLINAPAQPGTTIEGMNTVVLLKKDGRWLRTAHRQRIPVKPEGER